MGVLIVFCASLGLILYVYFGYPALLCIGILGRHVHQSASARDWPMLTVVVPAHNEERLIEAKIQNLLASDYPRGLLEILIGNDGSSDATAEIVGRYSAMGVGMVSFPQHHGKSAIQNALVPLASGLILVFTDADCVFAPDALRILAGHFANPSVGLVTARPRFGNEHENSITRNEGVYLRYDTWLRKEESARGILAMASGSLFAMRRALWKTLDPTMGDDFVLPLQVARAGFRNVLDDSAVVLTRLDQTSPRTIFRMKVRIIAKDFRALLAHRELLNPFLHGSVAVGLLSHKLLRWLVPYFLVTLLASNVFLYRSTFFWHFLECQAAFYLLAACGLCARRALSHPVFAIPTSFCLVNGAALLGTLYNVSGRTVHRWHPSRSSGRCPQTIGARPQSS